MAHGLPPPGNQHLSVRERAVLERGVYHRVVRPFGKRFALPGGRGRTNSPSLPFHSRRNPAFELTDEGAFREIYPVSKHSARYFLSVAVDDGLC
jgi:hypothetical protein